MANAPSMSERKRVAIIDAALEEFREKGFRATSMDALSARAGVSKRTVYNHFESKEVLFKEIAHQLLQQSAEVLCLSYIATQPLQQQLKRFADNELQLLQSERFMDVAKIMVAECIHSPALAAEAFMQANQQEQGLNRWIEEAIADGKLKTVDSDYAAAQFMSLIKAHAFWPQLLMGASFPNATLCEKVATDSVAMFLSYYEIR